MAAWARLLVAMIAIVAVLPRISLVVQPHVLLREGLVRLECHLPHHPENRWLEFGLEGWSLSLRQLDGDKAAVIYTQLVRVPCGEQVVYCLLTDAAGHAYAARAPVLVACEVRLPGTAPS